MDTTRARLSLLREVSERVQWVATAALIAFLLLVCALAVRELRFAPRASVAVDETATNGVPTTAVSVAKLVLGAGRGIHVGESAAAALSTLTGVTLVKRTEERGPLGRREIRAYDGFTLVFEPFERAAELKVAAIYLQ
jgi:hypothetical protein